MDFKRAVLIAAAACTVALTGCAARSEYYGVFVAERVYDPEETKDTSLHIDYYPEIIEEYSAPVSTPSASSVTSAPLTSAPEAPPAESAAPPVSTPAGSTTTTASAPEPQTTPDLPQTEAASKPPTPASSARSTPSAPSTPAAPSTFTTPQTPTSTHAPATNPINPATAAETPKSSVKAETTTATVAAAVDEPASAEEYITEVLRLVNAERANEGLSPLVLDSDLCNAARVRAEEQIELFGHTRPDGQSCFSVFKEFGIGYSTAGENAAAGYLTPQEVVNAWMSSDGHRANILKPCFEKLGVGFVYSDDSYKAYWVQLFIEE